MNRSTDRNGFFRYPVVAVFVFCLLLLSAGCGNGIELNPSREANEKEDMAPWIGGTVAEFCRLVGVRVPISGWGIAVGLEDGGSGEVPPRIANEVRKYLRGRIKLIARRRGTMYISVKDFMADPDTALVQLKAFVPAGAPVGTRIDVEVEAWPRTQTTSLEGGLLLPIDMHIDRGIETEDLFQKSYAKAEGMIFVNPFIDIEKPGEKSKLRSGRILGGATLTRKMPVRLEFYDPNYFDASLIQNRINQRFKSRGANVAVAKNREYIEINIPRRWKHDYRRFLELLMHLPVRGGPAASDILAANLADAMTESDANCRELSLVWEAMGKEVLPTVQQYYSSSSKRVAYYSVKTGLRLGDKKLAGPEVIRFASSPSPFQIAAVHELGDHPALLRANKTLRKLLDDPRAMVRVAAYESLLQRGDYSSVRRIKIGAEAGGTDPAFVVDIVDSSREFVIYATSFKAPKLVLFGNGMPVKRPVFFESKDKTVTIYSTHAKRASPPDRKEEGLVVYRSVSSPFTDKKVSRKFTIDFSVRELVSTLGAAPRPSFKSGEIKGLGVTYSRIVSIINRLCSEKTIPAKFYLQNPSEMRRIHMMNTPVASGTNPGDG